jgi:hypothetical protein
MDMCGENFFPVNSFSTSHYDFSTIFDLPSRINYVKNGSIINIRLIYLSKILPRDLLLKSERPTGSVPNCADIQTPQDAKLSFLANKYYSITAKYYHSDNITF